MRRLSQLVLASSCLIASLPHSAFAAPQVINAGSTNINATGIAEGVDFVGGDGPLEVLPGNNIGNTAGVSVSNTGNNPAAQINFQGTSIVTGSITAAGSKVALIEIQGGVGTTVTFNGVTTLVGGGAGRINFTKIQSALQVNANLSLPGGGGRIDFGNFGANSTVTFADGVNLIGGIDTNIASTGTAIFEGNITVSQGLFGATQSLLEVQLGSGTVYLNQAGTFKADNFNFTGATGANTLKLLNNADIAGNIDNTSGTAGRGNVVFEQDGTITGNIGATSPIALIRMSDINSAVSLVGNVNANTIQLSNTIIGNQNTLTLSSPATSTVNTNIITSVDQLGVVNLSKVGTFTGNIGSSTLRVKEVLVGANNNTIMNGNIYTSGGVKFQANNTLTIADGNFINGTVLGTGVGGKLVFAGSSQSFGLLGDVGKGLTSVSFNGGTFNLNNAPVTATDVNVKNTTLIINQDTEFKGNLNLDPAGANLQIGNHTVQVGTNLVSTDVGTIKLDLQSPAVFGNIDVTNQLNLTKAPVFDITTSGYIPSGTKLNIVTTGGAFIGGAGPGSLLNTATLLSNFSLASVGNNIQLTVTRNTNASVSDYPFTAGIAGALDAIQNTPALIANPDIFAVVNELDNFTSRENFNRAIATLAPSVDGDNFEGMMAITRLGIETIRERLDNYRLSQLDYNHTGYAAGSYNSLKDYGVWVKLLASRLKQTEYRGVEGYKSDVWGIAGGLDYTSPDNMIVYGLGFNYSTTESLSRSIAASKSDISSYSLMLYGTYNFDNPWYLDTIAYFTKHDYEQTRNARVGAVARTAKADFSAWQISARAETGFVYQYNKVLFQPIMGLFYSHLDRDDYTENGAGGLNLVNRGRDLNSLRLSVGPKISSVLGSEGASIIPELHAYYNFELLNSKEQYVSNFVIGGPTFVTDGIEPKRSSYIAGFGLAAYGFENLSCHVSLDYEFNSTKFSAWHGSLKFKYTW